MPRRNLAWLLGIASVYVTAIPCVLLAGLLKEKNDDYKDVSLVVDVLHEVDQKYERKLTADEKRKLIENMVNGGLEKLDPHSQYIPPKEFKALNEQTRGEFGGVGIKIEIGPDSSGRLTVSSPMPGTPAYKAGVLAGDVILKINGEPTDNMTQQEAIDRIKGPEGKEVVLTVLHEGSRKAEDIKIVRAKIKVENVLGYQRKADDGEEWDYWLDRDRKIACVRLVGFSETAAEELRKVVKDLQDQGLRGLVLDLRDNPGGLLSVAVDICDLFLPEGANIVTVKGRSHDEQAYKAKKPGELTEQGRARKGPLEGQTKRETLLAPAEKYPMVVLVNRGSASASEIVAATLQDHKRAVVVGERSYGKGSVQNVILMENGSSALKLTTARYWRPSNRNIHRDRDSKENDDWGVRPNLTGLGAAVGPVGQALVGFEVPVGGEERLRYLTNRRDLDTAHGKEVPPKPDKDKKPFVDRVLQRAAEHLRNEVQKVHAAGLFSDRGDPAPA